MNCPARCHGTFPNSKRPPQYMLAQRTHKNRHWTLGWLCLSSDDEPAVTSRHSGVPCSWQAAVSSDDDEATCGIIRQPAAPSKQRPPKRSRPEEDEACPIIRHATLAGKTPDWAESDSDVETLAPSRHSGVPCPNYTTSKPSPTEPRKIDINVDVLKVCSGRGAIKFRDNLAVNDIN